MQDINWFKKINAVLATIGCGDFNSVQDRKTYAVMSRAIRELMASKTIADPLKSNVIQNIAIRVGPRDLVVEGDIGLTKNQRQYARRSGWADFPTYEQRYGSQELVETVPADFQLNGFSDADTALVATFLQTSIAEQKAALVEWIKAQNEPVDNAPVAAPASEQKPTRKADALTIWVKESIGQVRASGNLEVSGHKFSLNFSDFYSALDRIPEDANAASWRTLMAGEVANAVLPKEREAEGVAARSTMSGLFAANDTRGFKAPVTSTAAVVLEWSGAKPVRAHVYDGGDYFAVEVKQETNERFKGAIRFAA